jgi:hypothetical protein
MFLMPPQPPPYPYVDSATINGDKIQLSVGVDNWDAGTYIEISGSASQTGGAFANFYDIQPVPDHPNDPDDPESPHRYVFVSAHPLPPNKFREDEDVTTVIRVGKVWLTVLGKEKQAAQPEGTQPAREGAKWGVLRKVAEITGDSQKATGDPTNPAASS